MLDLQKFLNADLQARRQTIDVPELQGWAQADAPAQWTVRGLTAAELARANQAAETGIENVRAMIAALAGTGTDKSGAIRQAMGLSDEDVPADISRRIEMLTAGSVDPVLGVNQRDVAVKLSEAYAGVFYKLTNAIINLTGQGAEPGKSKRSGPT